MAPDSENIDKSSSTMSYSLGFLPLFRTWIIKLCEISVLCFWSTVCWAKSFGLHKTTLLHKNTVKGILHPVSFFPPYMNFCFLSIFLSVLQTYTALLICVICNVMCYWRYVNFHAITSVRIWLCQWQVLGCGSVLLVNYVYLHIFRHT